MRFFTDGLPSSWSVERFISVAKSQKKVYIMLCKDALYIKALLRVPFGNYCMRGVVKTVIQHEAKLSAVSASRPHCDCYNSHSIRVYSALIVL